ncbi:aldehyde dehydrogenase, partial [bacterium]|nr:aldehyde dehydrogenase [bacterium]
ARARIVLKAFQIAESRKEELSRIMAIEGGKVLSDARGEITKGNNLLEFYAGEGFRFYGQTAPSELAGNMLFTIRQPIGVASIITPWNFPWAIPCWKIAPALVAGCTVVFKPASFTPFLAAELVKCFDDAGLPKGVLNFVTGAGSTVGNELITHPAVRVVSFTGSTGVGRKVEEMCGMLNKKVTCEMGGKNPCVILADADLDGALGGVIRGAFGNAGQRCTATSRLILEESIADKFLAKLLPEIKKIKPGPGLDPSSTMSPLIDATQLKTVMDYIAKAKSEGNKLLAGGGRVLRDGLDKGYFVEPTVFDHVKPGHTLFQEEVFGPVLAVTRVKDFDEACDVANRVVFGLSSSIYTRDINKAMRFIERIEAGMVHVNSPTIGGEAQIPFGGIKESGCGGREMAKEGIEFFTEQKTVFVDYTGTIRTSNIY